LIVLIIEWCLLSIITRFHIPCYSCLCHLIRRQHAIYCLNDVLFLVLYSIPCMLAALLRGPCSLATVVVAMQQVSFRLYSRFPAVGTCLSSEEEPPHHHHHHPRIVLLLTRGGGETLIVVVVARHHHRSSSPLSSSSSSLSSSRVIIIFFFCLIIVVVSEISSLAVARQRS
jgi:hypothetical protein